MKPEDLLQNLNLSAEQTDVYLSLLRHGNQTAGGLAKTTPVKRTYVYSVCQELTKLGLVKIGREGKAAIFSATSPDLLLNLSEQLALKAKAARASLETILPDLQALYRLTEIRPVVSHYEGLEGVRQTYKDLNKTSKDILLFRSVQDDKNQELNSIITGQIKAQMKLNIHTRTITPLEKDTKSNYLFHDSERLVERHITRNPKYLLPSQIIVYGTKVVITSLKDKIHSTIIDNFAISKTFANLFDVLWEATQAEHDHITATWTRIPPKSPPIS